MKTWLRVLDRILRGEMTRGGNLEEGLAKIPVSGMTVLIIALGAIYGMGMGSFALFKAGGPSWAQFLAATLKIPALFLLTLLITFPSLYVFNALVGSRLLLLPVLRLLVAALSVTMAILASFGPIVVFFSISTTSYPFMVLLNVAMCAVAGVLGLSFLRQTLQRLTYVRPTRATGLPSPAPAGSPAPAPGAESAGALSPTLPPALPAGPLEPLDDRPLAGEVRNVFRCWMVLFALVGSQMSWVLRPFIGDPSLPFTLFRPRGSNFFAAVSEHLLNLFR